MPARFMRSVKSHLRSLVAAVLIPGSGLALTLEVPATARETAREVEAPGSTVLALSGWREGEIEALPLDGEIQHVVWQIAGSGLTTAQLLSPLQGQLDDAGFVPVFACETRDCGGFDFRYAIDVVSEPAMHVNLGDFRYIALRRDQGGIVEHAALLVSRSTGRGFVQLTHARPMDAPPAPRSAPPSAQAHAVEGLANRLVESGRAALSDLTFQPGSATLSEGAFASLSQLAEFLKDAPDAEITLVGHTDADGTLAANIALSRKRAAAVRARLISEHGVAADRVAAEGVGFLAPRASNATEAGREQNRRVEVVLSRGP